MYARKYYLIIYRCNCSTRINKNQSSTIFKSQSSAHRLFTKSHF